MHKTICQVKDVCGLLKCVLYLANKQTNKQIGETVCWKDPQIYKQNIANFKKCMLNIKFLLVFNMLCFPFCLRKVTQLDAVVVENSKNKAKSAKEYNSIGVASLLKYQCLTLI